MDLKDCCVLWWEERTRLFWLFWFDYRPFASYSGFYLCLMKGFNGRLLASFKAAHLGLLQFAIIRGRTGFLIAFNKKYIFISLMRLTIWVRLQPYSCSLNPTPVTTSCPKISLAGSSTSFRISSRRGRRSTLTRKVKRIRRCTISLRKRINKAVKNQAKGMEKILPKAAKMAIIKMPIKRIKLININLPKEKFWSTRPTMRCPRSNLQHTKNSQTVRDQKRLVSRFWRATECSKIIFRIF